jgi:hypothetical protein
MASAVVCCCAVRETDFSCVLRLQGVLVLDTRSDVSIVVTLILALSTTFCVVRVFGNRWSTSSWRWWRCWTR